MSMISEGSILHDHAQPSVSHQGGSAGVPGARPPAASVFQSKQGVEVAYSIEDPVARQDMDLEIIDAALEVGACSRRPRSLSTTISPAEQDTSVPLNGNHPLGGTPLPLLHCTA